MNPEQIPFNIPYVTGRESEFVQDALERGQLSGSGFYTKKCEELLQNLLGAERVLLTNSCSSALDIAAHLVRLEPEDEVIMPSWTFTSTANAVVSRGAKPVFIDIKKSTLNIDESQIIKKITKKTRSIIPVHYAGISCNMSQILEVARANNLTVIEDAAQGFLSTYNGKHLGTLGQVGCISFHETKNLHCGDGGALIINKAEYVKRAEIIRDKGTNRLEFLSGKVDKYTWCDIGSSYNLGELKAAFLYAQLLMAEKLRDLRNNKFSYYSEHLRKLNFITPTIPSDCEGNGHIFYVRQEGTDKKILIEYLNSKGIAANSHYVPLHSSPFGMKVAGNTEELPVTALISSQLVRLPIWNGIEEKMQNRIIEILQEFSHNFSQL